MTPPKPTPARQGIKPVKAWSVERDGHIVGVSFAQVEMETLAERWSGKVIEVSITPVVKRRKHAR